jgi:hypothetical protein
MRDVKPRLPAVSLSQRTDKLVRRSLQKKKGGFRSVEEEWLWGRQQLLGEIPTHPMKGTELGKKKRGR